jgi:pantetheine-phosphate adenylyltransferase
MKIAMYPGSFNPWHEGHEDVLNKALKIFDKVVIFIGANPQKENYSDLNTNWMERIPQKHRDNKRIGVVVFAGLLSDHADGYSAVIRGLRNGQDFEYEKTQQYWNEDLGLDIPTVYFISDRKLVHISSSAIKQVEKVRSK